MRAARLYDDGSVIDPDGLIHGQKKYKPLVEPFKGLVQPKQSQKLEDLAFKRTKKIERKAIALGQAPGATPVFPGPDDTSANLRKVAEPNARPASDFKVTHMAYGDPETEIYTGRLVFPKDVPDAVYFVSARLAMPNELMLLRIYESSRGTWEKIDVVSFQSRFMVSTLLSQWAVEDQFDVIVPVFESETTSNVDRAKLAFVVGNVQGGIDWMTDSLIGVGDLTSPTFASMVSELKAALFGSLTFAYVAQDSVAAGLDCFLIGVNSFRSVLEVTVDFSKVINKMIDTLIVSSESGKGEDWANFLAMQEVFIRRLTYWGALLAHANLWEAVTNASQLSSYRSSMLYQYGSMAPEMYQALSDLDKTVSPDEKDKKGVLKLAMDTVNQIGSTYSNYSQNIDAARADFKKAANLDDDQLETSAALLTATIRQSGADIKAMREGAQQEITFEPFNPFGLGAMVPIPLTPDVIVPPKSEVLVRGAYRKVADAEWARIRALPEENRVKATTEFDDGFKLMMGLAKEYVTLNQQEGIIVTKLMDERALKTPDDLRATGDEFKKMGDMKMANRFYRVAANPIASTVKAANVIDVKLTQIQADFATNRPKAVADLFDLTIFGLQDIERAVVDYKTVTLRMAEMGQLLKFDPALMGEVLRLDLRTKYTNPKLMDVAEGGMTAQEREKLTVDFLAAEQARLTLEITPTAQGGGVPSGAGGARREASPDEIKNRQTKIDALKALQAGLKIAMEGRYDPNMLQLFADVQTQLNNALTQVETSQGISMSTFQQLFADIVKLSDTINVYENDAAEFKADIATFKGDPRYNTDSNYRARVDQYQDNANALSSLKKGFDFYRKLDIDKIDKSTLDKIKGDFTQAQKALSDMIAAKKTFDDATFKTRMKKIAAQGWQLVWNWGVLFGPTLGKLISLKATNTTFTWVIKLVNGAIWLGWATAVGWLVTRFVPFGTMLKGILKAVWPFSDNTRKGAQQSAWGSQYQPDEDEGISLWQVLGVGLAISAIVKPGVVIPGIMKIVNGVLGIFKGGGKGPGRPPKGKKGILGPGRPVDVNKAVDELERARQNNNPVGVNKALSKLKKAAKQGLPVPAGLIGLGWRFR
jgi:hypothetical protein